MEIEEEHRPGTRDEESQNRRKSFEHVACVLDDDCREESTRDLQCHHGPSGDIEALKEAMSIHCAAIELPHRAALERDREEAKLHVAHP